MSNSKSKILVPYDFSDDAENALNLAYQIAGRGEYDIILYHTIEVPHYPYVEPEFKDSHTSQLLDMATAHLTTVVKNMSSDQINVKQQVETGSTSGSILNFIKKEKINLVIMGSQGIQNIRKALIGSTTEKVVRYASCPVLTVRDKIDIAKINDIVLASDLKATPTILTESLMILQQMFGAKLHILKINTPNEWKTSRIIKDEIKEFAKIHHIKDYTSEIYDDQSPEQGIIHYAEDVNAGMVAMPVHNLIRIPDLIGGYYTAEKVFNKTNKLLWTFAYEGL